MKKAFLFTLAALCVSAVQAVTTSWTSHGAVIQNQEVGLTGEHTPRTGFSAALIFDLSTATPSENLAGMLNVMSSTLCAGIGPGSSYSVTYPWATLSYDGDLPNAANDSWSKSLSGPKFQSGENIIGITFGIETNSNGFDVMKINWYINGTLVTNAGSYFTENDPSNNIYDTVNLNKIIIGSSEEMSNIKLYTMDSTATADDFATLPEPTALALLALGVAGLALKRKVA